MSSVKVRCNTDKPIELSLEFTKWKSNRIENLIYRTLWFLVPEPMAKNV